MIGTERKPAPKHAFDEPVRRRRRTRLRDNTSIMLVVVLVLGSGFVVGTTATFQALTRNTGTFTTAALSQPSAPSSPGSYMQGNSAAIAWTAADTSGFSPFNAGLGYRISRASAGGPTNTAGTSPGCASGSLSYSTVGYSSLATYSDSTIPTAAADQGEHYCYRTESVWPCCPSAGKKPVITSLDTANRVVQDVQTGYVAASVGLTASGATGALNQGDSITVNFNQPVNIASSVTTSQYVCADVASKAIRIGSQVTTNDNCDTAAPTYEAQRFVFGSNPSGTFTLNWPAPINCTTPLITSSTNTTTMAANIDAGVETCLGVGAVTVVSATSGKTNTITFAGNWIGQMPVFTMPTNNTGQTPTITDNQVAPANWLTLGTMVNSGTWTNGSGSAVRWNISAVNWTNCTVPATACNTVTVVLGTQRGTKTINMGAAGTTWTFTPSASAALATPIGSALVTYSYTGNLALCVADPSGSPTGGLCRPTSTSAL